MFRAFAQLGASAEAVHYAEEVEPAVHEQLLQLDGVLVWVNPVDYGRDRSRLDALLRDVATRGVWVSTHPDVVLRMGTKDVLFDTRSMEWGTEVEMYRSVDEFLSRFPQVLATSRASRVLKQHRGSGGEGVWHVELRRPEAHRRDGWTPATLDSLVGVREARRGSTVLEMPLRDFLRSCEKYFVEDGHLVDQPFQERIAEGLVRCYVSQSEVIGFVHQGIDGLAPLPAELQPPTIPAYQALRQKLEHTWIPELKELLSLDDESMPVLWDADFLLGPRNDSGEDTYVLCEINASCVTPLPEFAAGLIAQKAIQSAIASK